MRAALFGSSGLQQVVLLELLAQRTAVQAEQLGGLGLVALDVVHHALEQGSLDFGEHQVVHIRDGSALKVAALNHAGILLQPRALLSEELERGTLQEILADALPAPRPVNLLYPAREPLPLRLRLLIDYLSEQRHQL